LENMKDAKPPEPVIKPPEPKEIIIKTAPKEKEPKFEDTPEDLKKMTQMILELSKESGGLATLAEQLKIKKSEAAMLIGAANKKDFAAIAEIKKRTEEAKVVNITKNLPVAPTTTAAEQQRMEAEKANTTVIDAGAINADGTTTPQQPLAANGGDTNPTGVLSPMNPDGSVTLTISNFGRTVIGTQIQVNRNRMRTSGAS